MDKLLKYFKCNISRLLKLRLLAQDLNYKDVEDMIPLN